MHPYVSQHVKNISLIRNRPSVSKYAKAIYNLRLPRPKVSYVWDVETLFDNFKNSGENKILSDKVLSQNLALLLLLLGRKQVNTFFHLSFNRMVITSCGVTFSPKHVLKHSKPGKKLDIFLNRAYSELKLCVL